MGIAHFPSLAYIVAVAIRLRFLFHLSLDCISQVFYS